MAMEAATTTKSAISDLLGKVKQYLSPEEVATVEAAHQYATQKHGGQRRKSGEPYVEHPIQAAIHLADLRMDCATILAGLLHDVVEDTNGSLQEVQEKFGPDVARLVDGVTKLTRIERASPDNSKAHFC